MTNPWLTVPLDDYETHMSAENVRQAQMLAKLMGSLADQKRASSVALLGAAGGNGFAALDPVLVSRAVAVDINPDYLESCERRHAVSFASFEAVCADIATTGPTFAPVEFAFAGLIAEYVGASALASYASQAVVSGGHLAVVLQRPGMATVSPTGIKSIFNVECIFHFIEPATMCQELESVGFKVSSTEQLISGGGKAFALLVAQKG